MREERGGGGAAVLISKQDPKRRRVWKKKEPKAVCGLSYSKVISTKRNGFHINSNGFPQTAESDTIADKRL